MKRIVLVFTISFFLAAACTSAATAQCSICTKTAQQLGEKPAKGMNSGIIYLMMTPLAIMGYIGYRWWKSNKD